MNEFTNSYNSLKGTVLRTIIYTIGHFLIATTVLVAWAGLDLYTALTSAVIEPVANAVWFFILDRLWIAKD